MYYILSKSTQDCFIANFCLFHIAFAPETGFQWKEAQFEGNYPFQLTLSVLNFSKKTGVFLNRLTEFLVLQS